MRDLSLMTAISFIVFMSGGITGPVTSLYVEALGANYVAIGFLGTTASLTTIVSSYAWGRASDRTGRRKRFLVAGLWVSAVNYGLISIVPHYAYLYPLRILGAVALSAYSTSSLALMGDLLEARTGTRGRRMGVYRGMGSLGFGLMAFLSGTIADRLSIRAPFALAALFLLAASILALRVREPALGKTALDGRALLGANGGMADVRARLARLWQDARDIVARVGALTRRSGEAERAPDRAEGPSLAPLLVSSFLWALVTGAVYAVWANYMVTELGYSQTAMSRLWSLASTSEFPLMIAAGWLSDRVGRLPMLSLGFLAWALVFAGYVVAPWMPYIVIVQLIRGFAYSAFTATAMTYATEIRDMEQRGRVAGLYSAAGGLGAILGAAMGGVQTEWMGFRAMIGTHAVLIFGGAVYLAAVALRQRRSLLRKHGDR